MGNTYKVLGQQAPAANTDTTLYTVPASTQALVSSIIVCNRGAAAVFRVAVRPDGAAIANAHYLFYDQPIGANDTVVVTVGLTPDAADVITVRSDSANLSFQAHGCEIT